MLSKIDIIDFYLLKTKFLNLKCNFAEGIGMPTTKSVTVCARYLLCERQIYTLVRRRINNFGMINETFWTARINSFFLVAPQFSTSLLFIQITVRLRFRNSICGHYFQTIGKLATIDFN